MKSENAAAANTLSFCSLKPSQLAEAIRTGFNLGLTLLIEGPPGTGKTSIPKQVAAELGMEGIHLHAPTLQAQDFGIPWPRPESSPAASPTFKFLIPESLPVEGSNRQPAGMLLIDELAQAGQEVQKCFANLVQEREVYGRKLLPGWKLVATGNRVEDRAGAVRLLSHFRDRLVRVELAVSHEDWDAWARENPPGSQRPRVHPEIRAYLLARGGENLLFDFRPEREVNVTPRAWAEKVSPLLWNPPSLPVLRSLIAGSIGPGPMVEFMAYRSLFGFLPTVEQLFSDPIKAIRGLPQEGDRVEVESIDTNREKKIHTFKRPDLLYAVACMITANLNADNFEAALLAADTLPEEFGALVFLTFTKQNHAILNSLSQQKIAEIMGKWAHLIFSPKTSAGSAPQR